MSFSLHVVSVTGLSLSDVECLGRLRRLSCWQGRSSVAQRFLRHTRLVYATHSTIKRASSSLLATSSAPLSRLRNSQYRTTSSPTPLRTGRLTSLTHSSFWRRFRVMYRRPTRASRDTTVATPVGDGANALKSLLYPRNKRATIAVSFAEVVGPRA